MFYQTADSDVFLIALAIIAGIVVVIMVVATFILLRSENKKEHQTYPKEEIDSIPPVEIAAATPPKESSNNDLPSTPPVEIVAAPPREARPKIELQLSPRVIRSLWSICLAAALMFVFGGVAIHLLNSNSSGWTPILFCGLPFGIALAGTIGVRLAHLEWRLTILPALVFVAGLVLLRVTNLYVGSLYFLILAAIGGIVLPLMNREGKQAVISLNSLNWITCFIIASFLAFWGDLRLRQILAPPLPIPAYFYWFAIILAFLSPACIAVAWLRLTGTKWLPALLMIPSMPVGVSIISVFSAFPFIFSN
jgi:hypothetical protein